MPADSGAWDDGLYDENGDPLYPDRIYVPAVADPCINVLRPGSVPDEILGEFGQFELQSSISVFSVGPTDRYGRFRLVASIMVSSVDDGDEFGTPTLIVGITEIRPASVEGDLCD
jgi:hypothetical protein